MIDIKNMELIEKVRARIEFTPGISLSRLSVAVGCDYQESWGEVLYRYPKRFQDAIAQLLKEEEIVEYHPQWKETPAYYLVEDAPKPQVRSQASVSPIKFERVKPELGKKRRISNDDRTSDSLRDALRIFVKRSEPFTLQDLLNYCELSDSVFRTRPGLKEEIKSSIPAFAKKPKESTPKHAPNPVPQIASNYPQSSAEKEKRLLDAIAYYKATHEFFQLKDICQHAQVNHPFLYSRPAIWEQAKKAIADARKRDIEQRFDQRLKEMRQSGELITVRSFCRGMNIGETTIKTQYSALYQRLTKIIKKGYLDKVLEAAELMRSPDYVGPISAYALSEISGLNLATVMKFTPHREIVERVQVDRHQRQIDKAISQQYQQINQKIGA